MLASFKFGLNTDGKIFFGNEILFFIPVEFISSKVNKIFFDCRIILIEKLCNMNCNELFFNSMMGNLKVKVDINS